MELTSDSVESTPSTPYLLFPSRTRKYVRLTGQQAYETVNNLLSEVSSSKTSEPSREEPMIVKAKLGVLGAAVTIRIFPEGDVSSLDFAFSYKRAAYATVAVGFIVALLGLAFQSILAILGLALVIPLILNANNSAINFLDLVNKTLPFVEKEVGQKALTADRERWKAQPKDTDVLYKRLSEKHVDTWGDTKVLEYKIAEYQTLGLTRDEAIRKAAEEEGIN
jgi:hypothetical protein